MFSSESLSLLGFPLDIRAAMENAFARDESCGFGDDVYSMSVEKTGSEYSTLNKEVHRSPPGTRPVFIPQQRKRFVLYAQSQTEHRKSVVRRMLEEAEEPNRLHGLQRGSCGVRSEDRLLFGKLQPSSYNSSQASNHVTVPQSHRGSDTEQPMEEKQDSLFVHAKTPKCD